MRRMVSLATTLLLGGLAMAAAPPAADKAALQKVADAYAAAYNKGDAKGVAALFAPDGDLVDVMGRTVAGRENIEKSVAADLASPMFKGSQDSIAMGTVRMLGPDTALIDGTWKSTGAHGPDGKEMPLGGLYTVVLVHKDGQWWILALRPMVPLPAPAAH